MLPPFPATIQGYSMEGDHVLEQLAKAERAQARVTCRARARPRRMRSTRVSATDWSTHTAFAAPSVRQAAAVLEQGSFRRASRLKISNASLVSSGWPR